MMHLETDLSKIKRLADIREDENFRFRTFLKGKDSVKIDSIVHRLHKEITAQIDCTLCGNCCCQLKPEVYEEDVEALAQIEKLRPKITSTFTSRKTNLAMSFLKRYLAAIWKGKNAVSMKVVRKSVGVSLIQTRRDLFPDCLAC